MLTSDPKNEYYSKRVLKRLETVPARHHINQRVVRAATKGLELAAERHGDPSMEVVLEQLWRGSKALQALDEANEDQNEVNHGANGKPLGYIDLEESAQVELQ